ncbi:MAG TPA: hypothetical protein VF989_09955 [Polyangiaceae bacterium]
MMHETRWVFPLAVLVAACGGRDDEWDAEVGTNPRSYGLTGSVAVLDEPLNRALVLTSPEENEVVSRFFSIGRNVAAAQRSPDLERLYVLSRGVEERRKPEDELPSLTVLDGGAEPEIVHRYTLTDPLLELVVDPAGQWLAAFDGGSVVNNPNKLALIDLSDDDRDAWPRTRTLRSFGGTPQSLIFTDELAVPEGPARRFLVASTEQDLALVDLERLDRDEVTVRMPAVGGSDETSFAKPAQVVFDDGDPDVVTDARLAVRLENQSDVVLLELAPPSTGSDADFTTTINIVGVGGVPDFIEFVHTDGGVRLVALIGSQRRAALIDPATTLVQFVAFDAAYTRLTRVTTDVVAEPESSDVALLWSDREAGAAFWSLGSMRGTSFQSVDPIDLPVSISRVIDVPGSRFGHMKILESSNAGQFYVLDLAKRETSPMQTEGSGFSVNVSPDGMRAWAFNANTPSERFASIRFEDDLDPIPLSVSPPVSAVYDIERGDGGRAALVLHGSDRSSSPGTLAVTVLGADAPDSAVTRFYGGLLLGGLR